MRLLDRYILGKFMSTFFFMLAVIMAIAIIFDISEKIDDFIEKSAPLKSIILDYYVNFVLFYSNLFSSLLIFISVIFFTAKMAHDTEIVAILSSGVSFRRMLLPYFIGATILTAMSLYMNHWLIPEANLTRLNFENTYIFNKYYNNERDIHKEINPGEYIYFEQYRNEWNTGTRFTLERWNGGKLTDKIDANTVVWDTTKQKWSLQNWTWRKIYPSHETLNHGEKLDTLLNIHPSDFEARLTSVEAMNHGELKSYIEREIQKGSVWVPFYEVEMHRRTAFPFATYILTLIGVAIASRKVRGGIGLHIAMGLLICGIYILCMKVTTVFATHGGMNALLAVWIPNLIFTGIALWLLAKAHK